MTLHKNKDSFASNILLVNNQLDAINKKSYVQLNTLLKAKESKSSSNLNSYCPLKANHKRNLHNLSPKPPANYFDNNNYVNNMQSIIDQNYNDQIGCFIRQNSGRLIGNLEKNLVKNFSDKRFNEATFSLRRNQGGTKSFGKHMYIKRGQSNSAK